MAEQSNIAWTDATFSAWRGCLKVSEACRFCYADAFSGRNPGTLGVFGTEAQGGTRVVAADNYWKQPIKWDAAAAAIPVCGNCGAPAHREFTSCTECGHGVVHAPSRVFSASLSDVFEAWDGPMMNHKGEQLMRSICGWLGVPVDGSVKNAGVTDGPVTMDDVRARLFGLIDDTPNLTWQLLTKRPENIPAMWVEPTNNALSPFRKKRYNVWLGTTVENQAEADRRIPDLLKVSDYCATTFLSMEPLLGHVDLWPVAYHDCPSKQGSVMDPETGVYECCPTCDYTGYSDESAIGWVIVGCESGPNRRETKLEWVRDLRDQCRSSEVAFFVKQLEVDGKVTDDISKFPEDLRIREFPDA